MNATISEIEIPRISELPRKFSHRSRSFIWEAPGIALESILSHKLRTILTLLGIIIGVASVITVGGAIDGLGSFVSEKLISTFGSNTFLVSRVFGMNLSIEEWRERMRRNKRIYIDDMKAIDACCVGCAAISPRLHRSGDVKARNHLFWGADITGVRTDITKIQQIDISEGRFVSGPDVRKSGHVAVIGADVREELFGPLDALGKEIRLGGEVFQVIGVEKRNGSFFGEPMDSSVYVPYTTYLKMYGTRQSISIRVKARPADLLEATEDEVRMIMRSRHKLRPGEKDDFEIVASDEMQATLDQFTGAIAAVVTPITLISLVVGGIVVMNIMLVTVSERTREIGIRKAIGARRVDILLQFLVESSLLASLGGVLGLLLAYGLGIVIQNTTPIPMTITPWYVLLALVSSGGVGLIFGIYPAYKASKLDPIMALSRE